MSCEESSINSSIREDTEIERKGEPLKGKEENGGEGCLLSEDKSLEDDKTKRVLRKRPLGDTDHLLNDTPISLDIQSTKKVARRKLNFDWALGPRQDISSAPRPTLEPADFDSETDEEDTEKELKGGIYAAFLDIGINLSLPQSLEIVENMSTLECATPNSNTLPTSPQRVPDDYDGELICLKVKDVFGITKVGGNLEFVYTPIATFGELFEDVTLRFETNFEFELIFQDRIEVYELSSMPKECCLTLANLLPSREKTYVLTINLKRKTAKVRRGYGVKNSDSDKPTPHNFDESKIIEDIATDLVNSKKEFVGLKNTTMTCYLNSTLQGLFFTPEFRNLIYSCEKESESAAMKSLCKPLQRLFLQMQLSTRDAIETDELVKTFGWTTQDTWRQHDIEELYTLLMENLSEEFNTTTQNGMIKGLYYGYLLDYVRCLKCNTKNSRLDEFLVLPVSIQKPNQDPLDESTLDEAIKMFTTPEILDGKNQYQCSHCDKRVDAHKGILFKSLPRILTIQLKRFGNNWQTNRRFKLNDRLIFPVALNMNQFMDTETSEGSESVISSKIDLCLLKPDKGDRSTHSRPYVSLTEDWQEVSSTESLNVAEEIEATKAVIHKRLLEMKEKDGPEVYQLFAIFVHRGGLQGGHYFAYIRDFETYRWYRCDDSSVRKASAIEVKATFGDPDEKEQTSAYMLMYRRYDDANILPFLKGNLPPHILEIWNSMIEEDKKAQDEEFVEKNNTRIVGFYRNHNSQELISSEICIPKHLTIKEVASFMYSQFFPDLPLPSPEQVRTCRFDPGLGIIENSFENQNDRSLAYALRHSPPVTKNEGLILDLIGEGEEFFPYASDDLVFFTQCTDLNNYDTTSLWGEFHLRPNSTVKDLRQLISRKWHAQNLKMALICNGEVDILYESADASKLSVYELKRTSNLIVEDVCNEKEFDWLLFVTDVVHFANYNLDLEQIPEKFAKDKSAIVFNLNRKLEIAEGPAEVGHKVKTTIQEAIEESICIEEAMCGDEVKDSIVNTVPNNGNLIYSSPDIVLPDYTEPSLNLTQMSEVMQDLSKYKKTHISFVVNNESDKWIKMTLKMDSRTKANTLSYAVADALQIPESDFILFFTDKDGDEIEIIDYDKQMREFVAPNGTIKVRFQSRLKNNEGRVGVFFLGANDKSLRCGVYVGDVILNPEMTLLEAKAAVSSQCVEMLGQVNPDHMRLRKKLSSDRLSKIFREGWIVSDWINRIHDAEIVVQLFEDEMPRSLDRDHHAVIVRIWIPSEWKLEPLEEIVVFYDHGREAYIEIADRLKEIITDIPLEDMEIARVDDAPYPYTMNPMSINELQWFPLTEPPKRTLYLYNDELVLFVRNKTIVLKPWTNEEGRAFRKENDAGNLSPSPRKEHGLRMNLCLQDPPN